jgi:hypothetical protein
MPPKPKEVNVPASSPVAGMKATKLEYQAVEDDQEKALRLHKDRLSFYVKELCRAVAASRALSCPDPRRIICAHCVGLRGGDAGPEVGDVPSQAMAHMGPCVCNIPRVDQLAGCIRHLHGRLVGTSHTVRGFTCYCCSGDRRLRRQCSILYGLPEAGSGNRWHLLKQKMPDVPQQWYTPEVEVKVLLASH